MVSGQSFKFHHGVEYAWDQDHHYGIACKCGLRFENVMKLEDTVNEFLTHILQVKDEDKTIAIP